MISGGSPVVFPPAIPGQRPWLPLRAASWHEILLHASLFLAGVITLSGGRPALTGAVNHHPAFLIAINTVIAVAGAFILTGAVLRWRTGNLWSLLLEAIGLILSAGVTAADGLFSVATSPAHNYTSYLLLFGIAAANAVRGRQIQVDLRAAQEAAPK